MSIELKIKSKHLSEEARIIRFEEHKLKKQARWVRERQGSIAADELMKKWHSLNQHRRWDVRNENRATFLARAYLNGKSYLSVETKRKEENEFIFNFTILPRVAAMIKKYGGVEVELKSLREWAKL